MRTLEKRLSMGRLMPRLRDPETKAKKIMLNWVANAIILYASPVWFHICMLRKYRDKFLSAQRKSLLKMTAAYRTSTAVLQVRWLDLLRQERYSLFQRSKELMSTDTVKQHEKNESSGDGNKRLLDEKLIPNLKIWCFCMHKKIKFLFHSVPNRP